jgi:hypothetical protein
MHFVRVSVTSIGALIAVVLDEGRLHRVKVPSGAEPAMVVTLSPSCITATARPDRSESGFPRRDGGASLTH